MVVAGISIAVAGVSGAVAVGGSSSRLAVAAGGSSSRCVVVRPIGPIRGARSSLDEADMRRTARTLHARIGDSARALLSHGFTQPFSRFLFAVLSFFLSFFPLNAMRNALGSSRYVFQKEWMWQRHSRSVLCVLVA